METTSRRRIVVSLFGLVLLATSLSFAGQQTLSDKVAQEIWGGGCACNGSSTCSPLSCSSACVSFSGGSYSVCGPSASGACTPYSVACGTKSYCDGGEGDCDYGETDCTCHSAPRMVNGC